MVYRMLCVFVLISVLISKIVFPASASSIHYISNETELFSLEIDPEATYVLTNDIYLESSHSMMFGDSENSFKGVLDGKGYTIYNLKIESNDTFLAFIGFLDTNGVVRNLNFENGVIKSENESTFLSGIVAKNISGRVENCVFSGMLSVAGTVLDKPHFVCAMGSGAVVNSFYYLTYGEEDVSSFHESSRFTESVSSNTVVSYTESVSTSSLSPSSNKPSSSSKISSSSKKISSSSSKKISSSNSKAESSAVYVDMSSNVSTPEEEKSGKFVFYAAVFLLIMLIVYMVYTEIKFRTNRKNDKK